MFQVRRYAKNKFVTQGRWKGGVFWEKNNNEKLKKFFSIFNEKLKGVV